MAVVAVPKRSAVSLKLNAGTNPSTGNTLIRSVSMGGVKQGADNDRIMNVANLMTNVLEFPIERIEKTEVVTLENN